MKKRVLRWVFALAVLLPCLLLSAAATEERTVIASGTEGSYLTWTLYEDGELVLTGTGMMYHPSATDVPWYDYRTSITSVDIPAGFGGVSQYAFQGCINLTTVNIPDGATYISNWAFQNCQNLTSINIPESVTKIGWGAFSNCIKLPSINIPEGITEIDGSAFAWCESLTSVTIPSTVTSIKVGVFDGTGLTSVHIPDSVTSLNGFQKCKSLTEVTIGKGVNTIANGAFGDCTSLTKVEFMGNMPSDADSQAFYGCDNVTFYYHEGTTGWPESDTWLNRPLVMIPNKVINDTGRSISLEGEVFINQYVTVSGFEGIDVASKGGLLIWHSEVTEDEAVYGTADTTQTGLIAYGNEYTQRTSGIPMRRYADEVYLRVYIEVAEGEYVYGPLAKYSVQEYCEHKINTDGYSAKLKATCASLLHMGAMAQQYFNYNTNNLANANILEVYPAPEWMWVD